MKPLSLQLFFPVERKIKVKGIAIENRIGNPKARTIFQEAGVLGAIKRVRLGYLTTPSLRKADLKRFNLPGQAYGQTRNNPYSQIHFQTTHRF